MATYLKVEKVAVLDEENRPVLSKKTGKPVYSYDVVGELQDATGEIHLARVRMEVMDKSTDEGGKNGARGRAWANLDLFFGEGVSECDAHLEKKVNTWTDANGEVRETESYEVVIYDDIGFDMRVPMRPCAGTDKVVLGNLLRRQSFIDAHPEALEILKSKKKG